MNLSPISVLVLILAAMVCQAKAKPGLYLSPYGFHRPSRYGDDDNSYVSSVNAGLKDSVDQIKGQMVMLTIRGLLQNIAMKDMIEKINSIDERLGVVEGKMGIATTEKVPQVENSSNEEVTKTEVEVTTGLPVEDLDQEVDYISKLSRPFEPIQKEARLNDILNVSEKQSEYSYKE